LNKRDTSGTFRSAMTKPRALRSAGPTRGVLSALEPDGIFERYRVLPSAALSPFVHHFWSVRWALDSPFFGEALTHPAASLVIEDDGSGRRAEIRGVHTARVTRRLSGDGRIFGITFRPAMLQPLVGVPMATLTDRVLGVAGVLGSVFETGLRSLVDEPELEARIAAAEALLTSILPPPPPDVARWRDLVERMAVDRSLLRVEDVAAAVALDARTLQRSFRKYVGVTPKWVILRYRLHEAAEQLKARRAPALADLAASLGYADQAHFTRDFTRVVGQTPRAFVEEGRMV
jgi:AraC-like DNA-binding protein